MDWIKKNFKGSGQKNSEGHYLVDYAEDPQFYAPSSTGVLYLLLFLFLHVLDFFDDWIPIMLPVMPLIEHENEEIDRAIALSLLEESQKERNIIRKDEQLARAMQERLRFEPPPQYENANTFRPIPIHFPMGYRICAGCNTEIGHGRFLNCLNAFWHPECFRCHACNLPISDY
ncbi:hypothetical protein Gohar_019701, partial [Gossypium harknessii]|nr:hypothetical protein [Gossypium harknessii]